MRPSKGCSVSQIGPGRSGFCKAAVTRRLCMRCDGADPLCLDRAYTAVSQSPHDRRPAISGQTHVLVTCGNLHCRHTAYVAFDAIGMRETTFVDVPRSRQFPATQRFMVRSEFAARTTSFGPACAQPSQLPPALPPSPFLASRIPRFRKTSSALPVSVMVNDQRTRARRYGTLRRIVKSRFGLGSGG